MTLDYIQTYLLEPAHDLATTFNENDLKLLENAKQHFVDDKLKTKLEEIIGSLRKLLEKK